MIFCVIKSINHKINDGHENFVLIDDATILQGCVVTNSMSTPYVITLL